MHVFICLYIGYCAQRKRTCVIRLGGVAHSLSIFFLFECEFCPETPTYIGVVDDPTDEEPDEPECPAHHYDYDEAKPSALSLRLELQQTKPSRNSARAQAAMHVCWLHVHAFCWCVSTQLPGIARIAKAKSAPLYEPSNGLFPCYKGSYKPHGLSARRGAALNCPQELLRLL